MLLLLLLRRRNVQRVLEVEVRALHSLSQCFCEGVQNNTTA
jgi:hypothetical protein